jgi:hypothetical protein
VKASDKKAYILDGMVEAAQVLFLNTQIEREIFLSFPSLLLRSLPYMAREILLKNCVGVGVGVCARTRVCVFAKETH